MPNTDEKGGGVVEGKSLWHALGDPLADELLAKASLVRALDHAIKAAGLSQAAAAERLGVAQPNLSRVLSGRYAAITFDHLFKLLAGMGVDVRVTLAPGAGAFAVETGPAERQP